MKAIAVNSSPRPGGNTEILMKTVLEPLEQMGWETELLTIGGTALRGCLACGKCWKNKDNKCSMTQDKFNEYFAKILTADAIILGSPTYFTDVTAEMKAFIDRVGFVGLANNGALAGKIGAAVITHRRGGSTHAFDTINHLFQISCMVIPGSTYWNLGVGLNPGDVLGDKEGLNNMKQLGRAIDWLGKAIKMQTSPYPKSEAALVDEG